MFEVTSVPGEVNAWSEVRLPFQPKGEMLEFRQQLDSAIRAMPDALRLPSQTVATGPTYGAHEAAVLNWKGRFGAVGWKGAERGALRADAGADRCLPALCVS